MKNLIRECQRRRVFRVAALYVVGAWIVLQVADLAFESWGLPSAALRFVWLGAIFGFPISLLFGWRFDVIGGRILRTGKSADDGDVLLRRTDKVVLATSAIVFVAIVVGVGNEVYRTRGSLPDRHDFEVVDPRSIAVLPFKDMSESQDQEYFGDGMAEELLNRLAKVRGFRVAGRTSSFSFKGQHDDLRAIGDKLNVSIVLEGSVRKAGNRLRITAQLVNAADGFYIWSETYDRDMDNVFSIQDEIAISVVGAIQTTLLGNQVAIDVEPATVADSDAYVLYLKGRYLVHSRSGDSDLEQQALDLFEEAIAIDPNYAPAHAGLATALVLGSLDQSIVYPRAEVALSKALVLDPENSEALATLGLLRQMQGQRDESRENLRRAIASNPNNALAHSWLGRSYAVEDPAMYFAHAQKAYRTDPLDRTTLFHLSVSARCSGHYAEALAAAKERHTLDSSSSIGYFLAGEAHHYSGRMDRALKTYYYSIVQTGDNSLPLIRELISLRDIDLAQVWILAGKETAPDSVPFGEVLVTYLGGQPEQAYRLWSKTADNDYDIGWGNLILLGDFDAARKAYERLLLNPGQDVPQFEADRWPWFADYALTLQRTGEPRRAAELIADAIETANTQLASGVLWGQFSLVDLRSMLSGLHAMNGDTTKAMEELRRAAGQKEVLWCTWCVRFMPYWDELRGNPAFESLLAEQEAKRDMFRRRLAEEGMLLIPAEVVELESFQFDPFAY